MTSTAPSKDPYGDILVTLGYPKSTTLRELLQTALTETEAACYLQLPASPNDIAASLDIAAETVTAHLDRMALIGMIRREAQPDGTIAYAAETMVEPLCDLMMYSLGPDWDAERLVIGGDPSGARIADLWHRFFEEEWYRFARTDELLHRRVEMLGGPAAGRTFSVTPAWKALEKCDAPPPPDPNYDLRHVAGQVKAAGKKIATAPCSCKVRGRKSAAPIYTCGSFQEDYMPAHWRSHPRPFFKLWEPEDWLEMMGNCEVDFTLVHVGLPPHLFDVCTCDTECCNIFTPLKRHAHCYEGVEKSPYQAEVDLSRCEEERCCIPRCRFEAITAKKDETGRGTTAVDPERCVGCGQCVLGCDNHAIRLVLRDAQAA